MDENDRPAPKLRHSEEYTKACNVRQFEELKRELEAIIAQGKALGLAVSAWEKERADVEEQIRTLQELQDRW